jgi:hypothetical protein
MVGAWVSTHLCLAHLAERGHEVDVVPHMMKGHAYDLDGVHVHPGAKLTDFDADVVLSHLGDDSKGAEHARRLRLPSVRMVHGLDGLNRNRLARRPPSLAVFNSESLRRSTGWSGHSVVVHPPVDVDVPRSHGDMVTLVNLAAPKGGGVFAQIAERMPDRRFLGVRGGYGRQVDQTAANVEVAAPTHRMVADVYARTRVLLMPSKSETWGMVAVEAMACGIPVIASPTPGLRESLGSAGIFADRRNVDEWVAAIRRLDDPDEWQTASERSLERAAELDPAPQLAKFARAVEALA